MLIGLEKFREDFKKLIDNRRLSHAYLFFGEEENNREKKFSFAQSLANFLENSKFELPNLLLNDILIILPDEKGTIGIDNIRILKNFLWQKPINSRRKTVIIQNAKRLTPEAQNAALKIVEEPPESALIIFITNSENDLLPVLTSRLQKIYFPQSPSVKEGKRESGILNKLNPENIDQALENMDQFFESLIKEMMRNPIKNSDYLREILKRLTLIKQFNTNKKLQLKSLRISKEYQL